jgi:hypothetical protein
MDAPLSGPDRVRLAIARDRGAFAPSQPLTLCGTPDGTERRADAYRETQARTRRWTPQPGWGEQLAGLVQCPSCLGLRFGPVHLSRLLLIGRH